jgi:hypothetical protein
MKKHIALICCIALAGFLAGCSEKPAPVKEGVIWKVVWTESPNTQNGLFREKTLPTNSAGPGGEYGVEMTGKLYSNFLEIERAGDPHTRIIPLSEIRQLEFGE